MEEFWLDQQLHGIDQQPMHSELPRSVGGTVFHSVVVESTLESCAVRVAIVERWLLMEPSLSAMIASF